MLCKGCALLCAVVRSCALLCAVVRSCALLCAVVRRVDKYKKNGMHVARIALSTVPERG